MGKKKNDKDSGGARHELAGLVERLAASVIDAILVMILLMLLSSLLLAGGAHAAMPILQAVTFAAPVAYYWYFWTRRDGQTPGKFALGIRVVKADGSPINDVDAVIRAIGYQVSAMLFGLGFIWAIFDRKNQTWHDKLARTYVVRKEAQRKMVETGA